MRRNNNVVSFSSSERRRGKPPEVGFDLDGLGDDDSPRRSGKDGGGNGPRKDGGVRRIRGWIKVLILLMVAVPLAVAIGTFSARRGREAADREVEQGQSDVSKPPAENRDVVVADTVKADTKQEVTYPREVRVGADDFVRVAVNPRTVRSFTIQSSAPLFFKVVEDGEVFLFVPGKGLFTEDGKSPAPDGTLVDPEAIFLRAKDGPQTVRFPAN